MTLEGWIFVAVLVALVWYGITIYNRLVGLRNRADASWSDVDVQLKRRTDLIPNLVEAVKGYAAHERGTLEEVIQARGATASARTPEARAQAENALTGALRQLFALAESYPELKTNESFQSTTRSCAT
jgi:LemA protein